MSDTLPPATYRFTSGNPDAGAWHVEGLTLDEGLNEPYRAVVDLSAAEATDPSLLLGHDATIEITRGAFTRRVLGLVERVEHGGSAPAPRAQAARIHVVPALAALMHVMDSRVFQGDPVDTILRDVLTPALSVYGRELGLELVATYPPREICVQYRETTFDFVHRLMEEEGIAYCFAFDGEKEKLVLSDHPVRESEQDPVNVGFPTVDTADAGAVVFSDLSNATSESVFSLVIEHQLVATSAVVRAFDWTQPRRLIEAEERTTDLQEREREVYLHHRGVRSVEQSGREFAPTDDVRQAHLERERQASTAQIGRGTGNLTGFVPGTKFELIGHDDPALDTEYLITRVQHRSGSTDGADHYENAFECIPAHVPWRPPRLHPKPVIRGIETATVVGTSGQEIETDAHARVRAQLHWDRQGGRDESSMCWMRVNQTWAGDGWGFLFLPRIGMEVMVAFVDGDPDRPVVIGALYNGANPAPYAAAGEQTKSTVMSNSSLGGGGYNELRFEDLAGSEEIFTRAQKDQNEEVLHDHNTQVCHDQTNTVDADQTQTIGGKQTEQIDGDQTMTVDTGRTVTVSGGFTETVDTGEERTVTAGSTETISDGERSTISGSFTETINGGETHTVNGNQQETFNASRTQIVNGDNNETNDGGRQVHVTGPTVTTTPGRMEVTAPGGHEVAANGGHTHICPGGQDHFHTLGEYWGGNLRVAYMDYIELAINRLQTFGVRSSLRGVDIRYTRVKTDVVGLLGEVLGHEMYKVSNKAETAAAKVEKDGVNSQS